MEQLYLRCTAALNAGKGVEAAAEFQKILDHNQDFLALWEDADKDAPIIAIIGRHRRTGAPMSSVIAALSFLSRLRRFAIRV